MSLKPDYECPRCGYKSRQKKHMHQHLYTLKKDCPEVRQNITLTEDIKEHVLANRRYVTPAPQNPMVNIVNNINTTNTIANYINKIDVKENLTKYLDFKELELQTFETKLEEKYAAKVKRLERNGYKHGFFLEAKDLMNLIDEVSSIHRDDATFEDMNLIFNNKYQKLQIYSDGIWDEYLVDNGLTRIIEIVKAHYLDTYEIYLIRRIKDGSMTTEHLKDYYKFIACFRTKPVIKGLSDNKILYNARDPAYDQEPAFHDIAAHSLSDRFYPMYQQINDDLRRGEIADMKRKVIDIIKRNSTRNIDEFNKKIVDLIRMDDGFKSRLELFTSKHDDSESDED
jgi:hypothetical protein